MNLYYFTSKNGELIPANKKEFDAYLTKNEGKKIYGVFKRETGVRTDPQNKSLHLYYTWLADELNEKGFTCKYILGEKTVELDWTPESVKEMIWRPIQKALTKKKSTTELDKTTEIDRVYEHLNRFFSNEPFCFHIPFPNDPNKKHER